MAPRRPNRLPWVQQCRSRHGDMLRYFRRPGYKRVPLPGRPGSDEFLAAYQAAMAAGPTGELPIEPKTSWLPTLRFKAPAVEPKQPALDVDTEEIVAEPTAKAESKPGDSGYVYFLVVGNRVKIGFSKSPVDRIATLKTALPEEIKLYVSLPGTKADERKFHRRFRGARVRGEWFLADPVMRTVARSVAFGKLMLEDG